MRKKRSAAATSRPAPPVPTTLIEALKPLQAFLKTHFPMGAETVLYIDVGLTNPFRITFDAIEITDTTVLY